jgi:FtsZ-binding cell division protein ZapB
MLQLETDKLKEQFAQIQGEETDKLKAQIDQIQGEGESA